MNAKEKIQRAIRVLRKCIEDLRDIDTKFLSGTILGIECFVNHLEHLLKMEA